MGGGMEWITKCINIHIFEKVIFKQERKFYAVRLFNYLIKVRRKFSFVLKKKHNRLNTFCFLPSDLILRIYKIEMFLRHLILITLSL